MSLAKVLSSGFFRFSKWKLVVESLPPKEGAILVGAPHTSNWDFFLMLAIAGQTGLRYRWLAKDSLFWWPLGPVLRALGGIPVDRGSSSGLVSDMARTLRSDPGSVLAITPKGTRQKRPYWHSGFYRIAEQSGLPLILAFVDSNTNTTGLGPLLPVTGDMSADMERVRSFYSGKAGVRPELTSEPRLKAESSSSGQ